MTRESILIILAALVMLSPWMGLPLAWLSWILPILGIAIIAIALTLRARVQERTEKPIPSTSEPITSETRSVRPIIS